MEPLARVLLPLVLAAASPLASAAEPPASSVDAQLQRRIERRLARAGLDRRAEIRVHVADGAARLEGMAVSYADSRSAERAARKETRSVRNELRVVPEAPRSDEAIRQDATGEVLAWERYGPFDAVAVAVREGVVELEGWVDAPVKKQEIEERLSRLAGVRDVHNDLRLQGFSAADQRLRAQLYRRIYADPLFERWAGAADPPVRVFVSRGRITLAGVVGTEVEKAAAGNIARSSLAFGVSNQLQVERAAGDAEERPTTPAAPPAG